LPGLFADLELVRDNRFIDAPARYQAVCWLDWLVWCGDAPAQWRIPLTKLLCGLPLDEAVIWSPPTDKAAEHIKGWLAALPACLPGLERCAAPDLQTLFLQRPGTLLWRASHWTLQVQEDASDILLREIPWPMTQAVLPWLDDPLPLRWL